MRVLTKISVIALVLSMLFVFAGCGGYSGEFVVKPNSEEAAEEELSAEELIEGDWVAEVDFIELMHAYCESEGEDMPEEMAMFDGDIKLLMSFDDGTVELKAEMEDVINSSRDNMEEYVIEAFEAEIGMSIEAMESETGMTFDEILEQELGMSLDEAIDKELEDALKKSEDQLETSKRYEFKDEELYINGEESELEFEGDDKLVIELEEFGELEFERD